MVTPFDSFGHRKREAVFGRRRFTPAMGAASAPSRSRRPRVWIPREMSMTVALRRSSRERPLCGRRPVLSIAIPAIAPLLFACVAAEPGTTDAATYHCENGIFFSVEFFGRSARVTTLRNDYLLERRPSSIGRKYSADDVFFIQDENRAVLVGATDGPYRRCAEK